MKKPTRIIKSSAHAADADLPDLAKPPATTVAEIPDRQVEDALAQFTDSLVDHDSAYSNAKHEVEVAERQLEEKKAILKFEADKVRAALKALNHPDVEKALSGKYYDAVLREALKGLRTKDYCNRGGVYGNHPIDGVKPWGDWVKLGATDAQIISNLRKGFRPVERYGSPIQIGPCEKSFALVRRGEHGSDLEKIIAGDELVSEIRRVLGIPQPKPVQKPAPKPAAKTTAAKASPAKKAAKGRVSVDRPRYNPDRILAEQKAAKSKPAPKAKEKDDGSGLSPFGNISSMKLEKDGKGVWCLKYRKGTHTKRIYLGFVSDDAVRHIAIAAFNKKEKLEYPAASIGMPDDFKEPPVRDIDADVEAPSNDDQTPVEESRVDSVDNSPADPAEPYEIFERDGRWRLLVGGLDQFAEPLKLDATSEADAITEAAHFVEVDPSQIKVIPDPDDAPAESSQVSS